MRIGLFGDVHGNYDIFSSTLNKAFEQYEIDFAIQAGDFNIIPGMTEMLKLKYKNYVHVIDGNHDDFDYIFSLSESYPPGYSYKAKNILKKYLSKNIGDIVYHPRGSTSIISGITFGFIGGGLNIDRPQVRKGSLGNIISNDDVNQALQEFSKVLPKIIISHSCPADIGIGMTANPLNSWNVLNHIILAGYNPGPTYDCGDPQLAFLWENLKVKPEFWVFGHFHTFREVKVDGTRFISLPAIKSGGSFALLDTENGRLDLFDIP